MTHAPTFTDQCYAAMDATGEWGLAWRWPSPQLPPKNTAASQPRYHHLLGAVDLMARRNIEAMDVAPKTVHTIRTLKLDKHPDSIKTPSDEEFAKFWAKTEVRITEPLVENLKQIRGQYAEPDQVAVSAPKGADATQVDGDHYKGMGDHQPWNVLQTWLTPEEYRGWQKGNAIVYLAREKDKGGDKDIAKAKHHLEKLLETLA